MYSLVLDNNYGLIMDIIPFKSNQRTHSNRSVCQEEEEADGHRM